MIELCRSIWGLYILYLSRKTGISQFTIQTILDAHHISQHSIHSFTVVSIHVSLTWLLPNVRMFLTVCLSNALMSLSSIFMIHLGISINLLMCVFVSMPVSWWWWWWWCHWLMASHRTHGLPPLPRMLLSLNNLLLVCVHSLLPLGKNLKHNPLEFNHDQLKKASVNKAIKVTERSTHVVCQNTEGDYTQTQ